MKGKCNIPIFGKEFKNIAHENRANIPCILSSLHCTFSSYSCYVLLNQTFPVCLITERKFYNMQNWLDSNQRFLQKNSNKNQRKTEKEKGKSFRKRKTGRRLHFGLDNKMAHGPLTSFPESVPNPSPPAADERVRHVIPSPETITSTMPFRV
jgi:hypothetical protein